MKRIVMTAAVLFAAPGLAFGQVRPIPAGPMAVQPAAGATDQQVLDAVKALSAQVAALQQQVNQQSEILKAMQITTNLTLTETDKTKAISADTETMATAMQGNLTNLQASAQASQASLNGLQSTVNSLSALDSRIDDRTYDMAERLYMTCILVVRPMPAPYGDANCTSAPWDAVQNGHYKPNDYNFDTRFRPVPGGVAPAVGGAPVQPATPPHK